MDYVERFHRYKQYQTKISLVIIMVSHKRYYRLYVREFRYLHRYHNSKSMFVTALTEFSFARSILNEQWEISFHTLVMAIWS